MKLKQVIAAHLAIDALISGDRANKYVLPSSVRIRMAGNLRRTKPEFEEYGEARTALVTKYGKKDEKGNISVAQDAPNRAEFDAEFKSLMDEDVDVTFKTVTSEELFGKQVSDPKTGEEKPQNQIDIEVITELLNVGILTE